MCETALKHWCNTRNVYSLRGLTKRSSNHAWQNATGDQSVPFVDDVFNPLIPRVKPWVIQSFVTFDSMDRNLKCDHSLDSCLAVLFCGAVSQVGNFGKFPILDLALSEVKGLIA